MICIHSDSFKTVPWKNGKGITQLIASSTDNKDDDWRFSRADVAVDGPFSRFPGMSRILTVIEGAGLSLLSNAGKIQAKPYLPVHFSGETSIDGKLWDGPVKNLNLIYSSQLIAAAAHYRQGPSRFELISDEDVFFALYCISGCVNPGSQSALASGDFGLVKKPDMYNYFTHTL